MVRRAGVFPVLGGPTFTRHASLLRWSIWSPHVIRRPGQCAHSRYPQRGIGTRLVLVCPGCRPGELCVSCVSDGACGAAECRWWRIFSTQHWWSGGLMVKGISGYALLVSRLILGFIFVMHGWQKLRVTELVR